DLALRRFELARHPPEADRDQREQRGAQAVQEEPPDRLRDDVAGRDRLEFQHVVLEGEAVDAREDPSLAVTPDPRRGSAGDGDAIESPGDESAHPIIVLGEHQPADTGALAQTRGQRNWAEQVT